MANDIVVLDFENAEVRNSDFESLKPEGWLTGEIINFYWTFLERREFHNEKAIMFLGTYTAYRISNAEDAHTTDKIAVQLSAELKHRQIILIPLNHRSHWSLLVYCKLTRTFYHYDSISKYNRGFAERAVGRFLRVIEPSTKNNSGFYFKSMHTPQQNNDFDCGIYVLAIAEELARRFINHWRKRKPAGEFRSRAAVPSGSERRTQSSTRSAHDHRKKETIAPPAATIACRRVRQPVPPQPTRHNSCFVVPSESREQEGAQKQIRRSPTYSPGGTSIERSRAMSSDLLMPRLSSPFTGFTSPFVALSHNGSSKGFGEPLLKGGGGGSREKGACGSGGRSREERLQVELEMLERAGLPRDFWLVTVEDIEYPHCMRKRIRALVLDLQRQQIGNKWQVH